MFRSLPKFYTMFSSSEIRARALFKSHTMMLLAAILSSLVSSVVGTSKFTVTTQEEILKQHEDLKAEYRKRDTTHTFGEFLIKYFEEETVFDFEGQNGEVRNRPRQDQLIATAQYLAMFGKYDGLSSDEIAAYDAVVKRVKEEFDERGAKIAEQKAKTAKKTAERKARMAEQKAKTVKKTAERKARMAEQKAKTAKKTAERKARMAEQKAKTAKKTAERKARMAEQKANRAAGHKPSATPSCGHTVPTVKNPRSSKPKSRKSKPTLEHDQQSLFALWENDPKALREIAERLGVTCSAPEGNRFLCVLKIFKALTKERKKNRNRRLIERFTRESERCIAS